MSCMYDYIGLYKHVSQAIRSCLIAACISSYALPTHADDFLDNITVSEDDGVYQIRIITEIDASEPYVRGVLTDYVHIYRLSDSIIESQVLNSPDEDKVQVETSVLCCVPVFCQEVTRVEEVQVLASGDIKARILPEKSDFRAGEASWQLESLGHSTRITYNASLEPDFFIPPLLGTQMVIDNMHKEFDKTFYRIQHIARINEEREWDIDYRFTRTLDYTVEGPCNTDMAANF